VRQINFINPVISSLEGGVKVMLSGTNFNINSIIKLRAQLKNGDIWEETIIQNFKEIAAK